VGHQQRTFLGNYATALTRLNVSSRQPSFGSSDAPGLRDGAVIAFLVVRRNFAGKQTLDFVSNLGGGARRSWASATSSPSSARRGMPFCWSCSAGRLSATRATTRGWAMVLQAAATAGAIT
jgi:hypothetical protein